MSEVSGSFSASAFIQYGFTDLKEDAHFIAVPIGDPVTVVTDFTLFTVDPDDPWLIEEAAGTDPPVGWIGLDVSERSNLRIYCPVGSGRIQDPIMAIWGPQEDPPGYSDDPWHFGDDNIYDEVEGYTYFPSLHRFGSEPNGTSYTLDDWTAPYSTDTEASGLILEPGKYWVAVWTYPSTWVPSDGPARLVLEMGTGGAFALDAVILATQTGSSYPTPPSYLHATGNANWGQASLTVNRPAGVEDDDLLVAFVVGDDSAGKSISCTGWTEYGVTDPAPGGNDELFVFTKTASSEPGTYTFTWSTGTGSLAVVVVAFRGGEIIGAAYRTDYSSTSHLTAALDVVPGIALAAFGNNSYGPTITWTLDEDLIEVKDISTFFVGLGVGYEEIAANRTVQYSATPSASTSNLTALLNIVGPLMVGFPLDAYISEPGRLRLDAYIGADLMSADGSKVTTLLPVGEELVISGRAFAYGQNLGHWDLWAKGSYVPNWWDGWYVGVVVLDITETTYVSIYTRGSYPTNQTAMLSDSVLGIWGPTTGFHNGEIARHVNDDDSYAGGGGGSHLHDTSSSPITGSLWSTDGLNDDVPNWFWSSSAPLDSGIILFPGRYYICIWPYAGPEWSNWYPKQTDIAVTIVQLPHFNLDAWVSAPRFYVDAFFVGTVERGFGLDATVAPLHAGLDAVILVPGWGVGGIALDAWVGFGTITGTPVPVRAIIGGAGLFVLAAVVDAPTPTRFALDAVKRKTMVAGLPNQTAGAYPALLNAVVAARGFTASAIVSDPSLAVTGSFSARAWLDLAVSTPVGSFDLDAVYDSPIGLATFSIDASVIELTKYSSFSASAATAAVGDMRGSFGLDALRAETGWDLVYVRAVIAAQTPFRLDAWLSGVFHLDSTLQDAPGATFSLDADISRVLTLDAALMAPVASTVVVEAVVADATGGYRGAHLDAVMTRTQTGFVELIATIKGVYGMALDAVIAQALTLDAFIQPRFSVGAYISTLGIVVYPPSQEGADGSGDGTSTFTSPTAEFDDSMVGDIIIIDGIDYVIVEVIDEFTVVVTEDAPYTYHDEDADYDQSLVGSVITIGGVDYVVVAVIDSTTLSLSRIVDGSDLDWSLPSGDPTDPVGGVPMVGRAYAAMIEWSRPNADAWTEITPDVMWQGTEFSQSARVGPGTFTLRLKGAHSSIFGGEEIRVSIEGRRVFGGYVTDVEYGYPFEDDYSQPVMTLTGVDYGAVLDRLIVYNAAWDEQQGGSGEYRPWKPFDRGTSDREIIRTIARRFMSDPEADGFDFTAYVDEIESPAPTTKWTMEPGTTLRNVLTEISRITEGVWWVDAYKNLHYHSRSVVTAPYPITDGDGGIACRGLHIQSSLSVVTNDVFVWGVSADLDTGDSDILYSRQTADADWDVSWWSARIDTVQDRIDRITQTPTSQRTVQQKANLAALRRSKAVYEQNLAAATGAPGSVERYGRFQFGEARQDILEQWAVNRRARAIMDRYSQPVVRGEATIFDPGYQAGMVVEVVSVAHGLAAELVIRQMGIDFVVIKEPDEEYYAVPRYRLDFGLDPEEPWDIYQFLPFPDLDMPRTQFNPPVIDIDIEPIGDIYDRWLDTFEREYESDVDFGPSTSERVEYRPWEEI